MPLTEQPAQIPGFYYDASRGRYFAITSSGRAGGSSAMEQYSTSSLSQVQRREQEQRIERGYRVKWGQTGGVGREAGGALDEQQIVRRQTLNFKQGMLGSALERRYSRRSMAHWEAMSVTRQESWELDLEVGDFVECLLWDEEHEELVLGTHFGRDISPCSHMLLNGHILSAHAPHDERWVHPEGSLLTSLSMSDNYIVSTALGGAGVSGSICLLSLGREGSGDDTSDGGLTPFTTLFEPRGQSVWCSAIVERGRHQPLVCAGASDSAFLLEAHEGCQGHQAPFTTTSDVFATEFLDARTGRFALGCRSGNVLQFDPRVPSQGSPGRPATPVAKFCHGSTVTHIKALPGGRYVVVSGMEDTLALYDLRFAREPKFPGPPRSSWLPSTMPVVTYGGYVNPHTIRHGLSFKGEDMSSFAIASTTGAVKMFATYTGEELQGPLSRCNYGRTVKALHWTKRGGLFVASGSALDYWSVNSFAYDIDADFDH